MDKTMLRTRIPVILSELDKTLEKIREHYDFLITFSDAQLEKELVRNCIYEQVNVLINKLKDNNLITRITSGTAASIFLESFKFVTDNRLDPTVKEVIDFLLYVDGYAKQL